MIIKEKMEKALNKQINVELSAFYLYLSMAAYLAFNYRPGAAHWFTMQANEEFKHAMRLNDYLTTRGGKVVLTAIKAPKNQWKTYLAVLEDAYEEELKVSALINDLVDLAKSEHDHATEVMLQWFVTEQVEEEDSAGRNVERLKSMKNTPNEIMIFDRELGTRK